MPTYENIPIVKKQFLQTSLNEHTIYIYIYSHPQRDCFVVSQLFRVARHIACLELGLKPAQLYVKLSIITLSHQSTLISSGIIRQLCSSLRLFTFLPYRIPECSIHSKSFAYIYIGRKTDKRHCVLTAWKRVGYAMWFLLRLVVVVF